MGSKRRATTSRALASISGSTPRRFFFAYYNTHSDYNNFLYFQCGLDTWVYDLQFLILKLNTVSPYNIINYDLTWTDTDG